MMKVLLLSAGFGDGHRQVALALREALEERGAMVAEVDCFEQTNKFTARMFQWFFNMSTRYFPVGYGASYKWTQNFKVTHPLWKFLALFSRHAFDRQLQAFEPDVVLQMFPDHASYYIRKHTKRPFLGMVLTDFSVHSRWFHSEVDAYFVPHVRIRADLERYIPPTSVVIDSGIPIRRKFTTPKDALRPPAEQPYVILATGGRGVFPDLPLVIKGVLESLPDVSLYVLCGRNEAMKSVVQRLTSTHPRLHAVGYVENMEEWIYHAEFAIVKPGGITLSECLALYCPMIFYRPPSGQEGDNAVFLEAAGAGKVAANVRELMQVLCDSKFLSEVADMRRTCKRMAKPSAAQTIADYVLAKVENDPQHHNSVEDHKKEDMEINELI